MNQAFTLIELLLVIAIVAILGGMATPFLSNFILRNNLDTIENKLVSSIRKAQEYSMDGKNDEAWGMCLFENNIRLFSGSCNSPSYSEDFGIPGSLEISGLSEIVFDKRGEIGQSVNIELSTMIESKTLEINKVGRINFN